MLLEAIIRRAWQSNAAAILIGFFQSLESGNKQRSDLKRVPQSKVAALIWLLL